MSPSRKQTAQPARPTDPWSTLGPDGTRPDGQGLGVDDFITTQVVRLASALRRTVTQPYVEQTGLTQSQWRILAVVAEHPKMTMSELVTAAVVDKSLASRTLRQLEGLDLVTLESVPNAPRKGLVCMLSPSGRRLHDGAIRQARAAQAAMIRRLSREERAAAWAILRKLNAICEERPAPHGRSD